MVDEMQIQTYLKLNRDSGRVNFTEQPSKLNITQAGSEYTEGIMTVGTTTHVAITLGAVGTPGPSYFRNLDTTNTIQIGTDNSGTFVPAVNLPATEFCLHRPVTPYVKSAVATTRLQYIIVET